MEVLSYKIDVDTSALQQEQMRMQMLAQQQTMSMAGAYSNMMYPPPDMGGMALAQQQAMQTAYQAGSGMASYGGLDPRGVLAQSAYMSSIAMMTPNQSNMVGLYGEPTMSPRFYTGSEYQYPRGFIPGRPDMPEKTFKSFARNSWGLGSTIGSSAVGLPGLGVGISLDDPIYRQVQSLTENSARQLSYGIIGGAHALGQGALMAGALASTATLGLGATLVNAPLMLAGKGLEMSYRTVTDAIDMGDYFRDAMAPYMRSSRLGGGPDAKQTSKFIRGMGDIIGRDTTFTSDDYSNILKLAVDRGFMQSADTTEKALKVVDNLGKNLKSMYRLGLKIKETNEFAEQMSSIGVNLAGDRETAQKFASMMSLSAFQSGQTMAQMMPSLVQAGQMFAQQGLAPSIGAQLHAQSQGVTGESIRTGVFQQEDLAYYGGQKGISESVTRAYGNLNRSSLGQLLGMTMMNNPEMIGQMGNISQGQLIQQMGTFSDPNKYYELLLRQPELSRKIGEMDPNAYGTGMAKNFLNMYLQSTGKKKMGYGEFSAMLMSPDIGMSPQDVRAFLKEVEGSDKSYEGARESMENKRRQVEMESYRNTTSILSETGRKNLFEKYFQKPLSNIAANVYETTGHLSEYMEEKLFEVTTGAHYRRVEPKTARERTNDLMSFLKGESAQTEKTVSKMVEDQAEKQLKNAAPDSVLKSMEKKLNDELQKSARQIEKVGNQRELGEERPKTDVTRKDVDKILEESRAAGKVTDMESLLKYIGAQKDGDVKGETKEIVDAIKNIKITPGQVVKEAQNTDKDRGAIVAGFNNPELNEVGFKVINRLNETRSAGR